LLGNEDWYWRSGLNYRTLIQPKNDTDVAKRDIPLGSSSSIGWLNSVYCNLGEELFAGIEVNVTQTDMDRSREIYDGEKITETEETTTKTPTWIAQPKSKWRDVSVRFAMSKRFDF
jgi:hypothetical protein